MKPYHKNPRQIKEKQFQDLRAWLLELGDLSGIVHDLNSDEVISGNQRVRAIDVAKCKVVLTEEPHEPDAQGTVAHGYVIWQGAKYNYRQVRWDARQCEKANIVANKAGGGWDFDTLANGFEMNDLLEWGFEDWELGMGGGIVPVPDAEEDEEAEDETTEISDGSLLALLDITIAEPRHQVTIGDVWQVGPHVLVVADVLTDWPLWTKYLTGNEVIFAPYPGPFVPLTLRAERVKRIVMVQPDRYIAGHILDHYEEVHGAAQVVKHD